MPLQRVRIQPGIDREGTQYTDGQPLRYWDADKVRFHKGRPQQIGGWTKLGLSVTFPVDEVSGEITDAYRGVARSLFDWITSDGFKYLGVGTNKKFYIEYGSTLYDITPIRATTSAGDPTFAATNGSSTITVTETAHGAVAGDYVKFTAAASLGGLITGTVLNHEYEIESVVDDDNYTIIARDPDQTEVTANASDTGNGGASTVAEYQLNTGKNFYVASAGWGSGGWGSFPWGGGSISFTGQLRLWSQTEYGDDLIFNPRGGPIFYWDHSDYWSGSGSGDGYATRAFDISDTTEFPNSSDAPVVALQVMLSAADKHVIAFGTNTIGSTTLDPLFLRWSDQENAFDWTPTAINSAGGQLLSSGNYIVGAVQTRQEILIFTDTSIHAMRFVGDSFVFQFAVISENVTSISPNAATAVGDAVFFMYKEGFYVYRGAVERLRCSVLSYVFDNIDTTQLFKVFATHNPDKSEVTWFYPDTSNSPGTVNRYVTYNYQDDNWTIGSFERGAWIQAQSRSNPIASSNDTDDINSNYLYYHEYGYSGDGEDIAPFIETGEIELDDGDRFAFLKRVVPDFRYDGNENTVDLTLTLKSSNFPQDDPVTYSTHAISATTKQIHTRVRARSVVMRISGAGQGYEWTMGDWRMDFRTDGKR